MNVLLHLISNIILTTFKFLFLNSSILSSYFILFSGSQWGFFIWFIAGRQPHWAEAQSAVLCLWLLLPNPRTLADRMRFVHWTAGSRCSTHLQIRTSDLLKFDVRTKNMFARMPQWRQLHYSDPHYVEFTICTTFCTAFCNIHWLNISNLAAISFQCRRNAAFLLVQSPTK